MALDKLSLEYEIIKRNRNSTDCHSENIFLLNLYERGGVNCLIGKENQGHVVGSTELKHYKDDHCLNALHLVSQTECDSKRSLSSTVIRAMEDFLYNKYVQREAKCMFEIAYEIRKLGDVNLHIKGILDMDWIDQRKKKES